MAKPADFTPDTPTSDAPDMRVAIGSPEFNAAVAQAVALALAALPAVAAPSVIVQQTSAVPATSLAQPMTPADEVTVRFRHWTQHRNTAYQRHQEAGFPAREAQDLVDRGLALIVHAQVRSAGRATRDAA